MAIFDIDEMINDPWAGLRHTDAYEDYALEEVQRLYDCGELEEVSDEVFAECMSEDSDCEPPTSFLFDGSEFTYLYYKELIAICSAEYEVVIWYEICKDGKIVVAHR